MICWFSFLACSNSSFQNELYEWIINDLQFYYDPGGYYSSSNWHKPDIVILHHLKFLWIFLILFWCGSQNLCPKLTWIPLCCMFITHVHVMLLSGLIIHVIRDANIVKILRCLMIEYSVVLLIMWGNWYSNWDMNFSLLSSFFLSFLIWITIND